MNKDEIIRMAREAGWSGLYTTYNAPTGKADWKMVNESLIVPVTMEQIERFAALVADAERTAMMERSRTIIVQSEERGAAAERETIAQLFDAIPELVMPARRDDGVCIICGFSPKRAAEAIRARTKP